MLGKLAGARRAGRSRDFIRGEEGWSLAVITGIIALIGGFFLGQRSAAKTAERVRARAIREIDRLGHTQAIDRANYLQTLRRELANILIWRDPDRYLQLYKQLHTEVTSLASWRPEEVQKRLAELREKYPLYSDFDGVRTREYLLYADGVSSKDDDQLEARYKDLVIFAALSVIADEDWKSAKSFVDTTSEEDIAYLSKYVERVEDTKLTLRLERAMDDYRFGNRKADGSFDSDFCSIRCLPGIAKRYGIHLKRTNEFGIYSFFVYDDGHEFQSFCRSDPSFQLEQSLGPVHALSEVRKTYLVTG